MSVYLRWCHMQILKIFVLAWYDQHLGMKRKWNSNILSTWIWTKDVKWYCDSSVIYRPVELEKTRRWAFCLFYGRTGYLNDQMKLHLRKQNSHGFPLESNGVIYLGNFVIFCFLFSAFFFSPILKYTTFPLNGRILIIKPKKILTTFTVSGEYN